MSSIDVDYSNISPVHLKNEAVDKCHRDASPNPHNRCT